MRLVFGFFYNGRIIEWTGVMNDGNLGGKFVQQRENGLVDGFCTLTAASDVDKRIFNVFVIFSSFLVDG